MNKYAVLCGLMLSLISVSAQTNFRTNGTGGGAWNNISTWQVENPNGSGIWNAASSTPTSASGTIEIRANDVVTITSNVAIDQTTIDANGTLSVSDAIVVTLAMGANSLVVNGTLNMLGESNIIGSGFLVVNGNLQLGSVNSTGALVNSTSLGNIRTTTTNRTYNSGSRVVYAGVAAQIMGSGHPTTTGVTTEINNSLGVSFTTSAVGNPTGTNLTIPGDLILTSGDFNLVSTTTARSITLNGNLTSNSNHITFSGAASSLTINGSGAMGVFPFPSGSQAIKNLVFNRTSGSVTFNNALTISGTVTISNGSVTLGGATSIKGITTLSSGTMLAFDNQSLSLAADFVSSGLLSASGASSLSLTGATALTSPINFVSTNNTLQNLTINKTNSTGTSVQVGVSGLNVTNTLTLTDGIFDVNNGLNLSSGSTFNFGASGTTPSSISQSPSGGPWTLNYSGNATRTTGPEIPSSGILNGLTDASTGIITLNQSLTIGSSGFTQTVGKFSCGANDLSTTSLTITAGTFIAPSTTLSVTGDVSVSGTFTNNSGTLVFAGSAAQSIIGSKATTALFNTIKINNGATLISPAILNVRGDFTNNGTFTAGTGTVIFGGTSAESISGTNIQFYDLKINKSTNPVTVNSAITVTDTLNLFTGSISNTLNNITLSGKKVISRTSGTITGLSPAGGPWSVVYKGGSKSTSLEIPSSGNLSDLTLNGTSGANIVLTQSITAGTLTISTGNGLTCGSRNVTASGVNNNGTLLAPSSAASIGLTLNGNLTNNGTFTAGTGTVVIAGTVQIIGSVPTFNNFTINSGGVFTAPPSITFTGNIKNNGTFSAGNNKVIFSGGNAQTISGTSNTQFYNFTLNKSSNSLAVNSNETILDSLNLTAGKLLITASLLSMASNSTIVVDAGLIATSSPSGGPWNLVYIGNSKNTGFEVPSGSIPNVTLNMNSGMAVTVSRQLAISTNLLLTLGSLNNISGLLSMSNGASITVDGGSIASKSPTGGPWNIIYVGGSKTTGLEVPTSGNVQSVTVNTNSGSTVTLNSSLSSIGAITIPNAGTVFTCGNNNVSVGSLSIVGTFNAPISGATVGLTLNGDLTNNGSFNSGDGTIVIASTVNINGTVPVINNLSISNTGTFVAPSSIVFQGNLNNDGSFNKGNGLVTFSGNNAKQILGSSKITFNNVTVVGGTSATDLILENTAGADLAGILNIDASVNPVVFDTDGSSDNRVFTVLSTSDLPTSDGSIGILSAGSTQLPGKITVQRFMSKIGVAAYQYQVFRDISSPVNTTVSDLQNSLPVTGPFANSSTVKQLGSTDFTVDYSVSNLTVYDETVITDLNGDGKLNRFDGYKDFPADNGNTVTTSFSRGQGYTLFIYGNDDPVDVTGNAKWSLSGQIWSGTFNLPVTYTPSVNPPTGNTSNDGWNLVGNPYPSTIDWAAPTGWTKTNISTTISIDNYNTPTGTPVVATYNSATNLSTNGGSRYIATGQGFWVHATKVSPVLTITENVKVAGTQTNLLRQAAPQEVLRLTLASSDNLFRDEALINFNSAATTGYDDQYDAIKLMNRGSAINLSTVSSDNSKYAINAMPFVGCATTVSLDVSDVKSGNYSLSFSDFESLSSAKIIQLKDNFTNTVVDVKQNQNYAFVVDANNPATFGNSRFSVMFTNSNEAIALPAQSLNVCDASQAYVTVASSSANYKYSLLAQDGSLVTSQDGTGNDLRLTIPNTAVINGVNQYTLKAVNNSCASLSSQAAVNLFLSSKPSTPLANSVSNCSKGSVKLTASGASSSDLYNWYEDVDASTPIANQISDSFVTPELAKSKTYYVSISNRYGCEGERVAVAANIVNLDPASIMVTGINTLQSSYDNGNQWYLDGTAIAGATDKVIIAAKSGDYKVVVSKQGCSTSAERTIAVVSDANSSNEIIAYPNPIKGLDKLTIQVSGNTEASGEMYNALGQKVSTILFNGDAQNQSANYYFNQENSGIYFLRVIQGSKISVFRIVKE